MLVLYCCTVRRRKNGEEIKGDNKDCRLRCSNTDNAIIKEGGAPPFSCPFRKARVRVFMGQLFTIMSSRRVILSTTRCVHASVPTNSFFLRSFLCKEMHFCVEILCSLFPLMKENMWDSRCFLWKARKFLLFGEVSMKNCSGIFGDIGRWVFENWGIS